jgi:hypothetical protein
MEKKQHNICVRKYYVALSDQIEFIFVKLWEKCQQDILMSKTQIQCFYILMNKTALVLQTECGIKGNCFFAVFEAEIFGG